MVRIVLYRGRLKEIILLCLCQRIRHKVGIQNPNDTCNNFNQWLAGLIDGDGCFQLSKKGYASLEIVMEIRDKPCCLSNKTKIWWFSKITIWSQLVKI